MAGENEFPQKHAAAIRHLAQTGGATSVCGFIRNFSLPLERRQLFALAQQTLGGRDDATRSLDLLVDVVRAGIEEGLVQSAAETTPAEAARRKDFANVLSYNLSADLAECWPGDLAPRARRHFEAGLAAAQDCVRWRDELAKPAGSRFMAWWARGAHELSLARPREAESSFERALDFARKAATSAPAACVSGGDFGVVLASGYLGLATKSRLFDEACEAFNATAAQDTGETAEDAAFGLAQLRWYAQRLADPNRPADLRVAGPAAGV